MKILHTINSVASETGGPVELVRQASRALVESGHTVEVASCDDPEADHVRQCPLPVHALGPGRLQLGTSPYGYTGRLVPWLRRHAADYDAVIVNGLWQYHSLAVWKALRGGRPPFFVHVHGGLDPWFKRAYPCKHLKKWLYWPWAEYRVLRDARAVIFTSEQERIRARTSFWLYRCNEVVAAPGISAPDGDLAGPRAAFLSRFPELAGKRILLFMGRLMPQKACDNIILAFARAAPRCDGLHLVMAGPDQAGWQADLERLAASSGVSARVTWTGMLAGEMKWGAFASAEALIQPSHMENFGITVVEALACGLPVLISDQVNICREIEQDGAGLVARDSAEGTIGLLEKWLGMSAESRRQMASNARDCFARRFEARQAAQRFVAMLQGQCAMEHREGD